MFTFGENIGRRDAALEPTSREQAEARVLDAEATVRSALSGKVVKDEDFGYIRDTLGMAVRDAHYAHLQDRLREVKAQLPAAIAKSNLGSNRKKTQ